MPALLAALPAAWYCWAFCEYRRRFAEKAARPTHAAAFLGGCACLALLTGGPLDRLADRSFAWHMLQHLGMAFVVPPLWLLGAPMRYALATLPRRVARGLAHAMHARPIAAAFAPLPAWLAFVAFLWISHFSGLYEAALEHPWIHAGEHALYLGTALLFWSAIVQTGFSPHPTSFAARLLLIFLTIPQGAFLGVALMQTRAALYPHYLRTLTPSAALADQHDAGAAMWIGGGLLLFCALLLTLGTWAAGERRRTVVPAS
jgi:putative membrane protein